MIEIDEKDVDQAVDEILGVEPVREGETPSTGGAQKEPQQVMYETTCRDCGTTFTKPAGSGATLCPACRRKRVSEGRKLGAMKREERKAMRERDKAAAEAGGRAVPAPTDNRDGPAPVGATIGRPETGDEAQEAWDALEETAGGDQTPGSLGPDGPQDDKRKKPEDMTAGELVDALAAGMRREPGDVVLALYQAARDVARAAGIQTRILIETMYEIDCTLAHVGSV